MAHLLANRDPCVRKPTSRLAKSRRPSYAKLPNFAQSPCPRGPFWFIANDMRNCLFGHFRKGGDRVSGLAQGTGHTVVVHNSFPTEHELDSSRQSAWISQSGGQGNSLYANNIWRATGHRYLGDEQSDSEYRALVMFLTNAFYSSSAAPKKWQWKATDYASEAALLAIAGSNLAMVGSLYGIDPFPNGLDQPLASTLRGIAAPIDGITEIAGDSSGNQITAPLDLGVFPKWSNA